MTAPSVFVSYSHTHRDVVRSLVRFLEIGTTPVFFDERIKPGEEWEKRLIDELTAASTFVIFWCVHSAGSDWVNRELALAFDLKKRIVPVRFDQTQVPD